MNVPRIETADFSDVDETAQLVARSVAGLRYEDLDDGTVEATRKLLLDALAVAIGGMQEAGAREFAALMSRQGGRPEAMLVGSGERLPANHSAAANSVMCRALDFDDVSERALMHTTASVVPAALAAAQSAGRPVTGREFLTAIAVGIDLANRMSLAGLAARLPSSGPRLIAPTFLVSVFAAAAAACSIWKLDARTVVHALGLAHSQASGNQQATFDGTLAVRVQQGLSTGAGVLSALMAAEGITGPSRPFDGTAGHFAVHWQGRYDRSILIDGLGSDLSVTDVSIKPYPCCKFTHNAIFACLSIREGNPGLDGAEIAQVDVHIPSREYFDVVCAPVEAKQNPRTQVDAQFSIPFTVATSLLKGAPQPEHFVGDHLGDPAVRALARKVRPLLQEPLASELPAPAKVEVHLAGGSSLEAESRFPPGHPSRPMSWDELAAKLATLAARPDRPFPASKQEMLVQTCRSMEECDDVDKWATECLKW